jgi:membrane-associated phospholipid phosphatase
VVGVPYAVGVQASVDDAVARWCAEHRAPALDDVFVWMAGADLLLGLVTVGFMAALCYAMFFRRWGELFRVVLVLAAVSTLTGWMKPVFDRPRPPADLALTHVSGSAMPSSHALTTSAILVAVVMARWWTSERWRRAALVVGAIGCVFVAAGMIYIGVHWLTDVLVGWVLGIGLTAALMHLSRPRTRSASGQP